ncbi:unnamed protein product [Schistocephalus solidus]|uniref:DUF4158 domain-containing protein n=1 Tax=Schistocephalus solidus TaxID=70667 RepID=A0A183SSE0_SCHSO|nr:unnamed protein product [Schistocephalus solidus]
MERVSISGGCPPKPERMTMYDDYGLWEDRRNVYLEAVDEGARPAAIVGRLDDEVYTVARAVNLTASLTPATIFERLRREFGRSSMPWVVRAALKSRRQHADFNDIFASWPVKPTQPRPSLSSRPGVVGGRPPELDTRSIAWTSLVIRSSDMVNPTAATKM